MPQCSPFIYINIQTRSYAYEQLKFKNDCADISTLPGLEGFINQTQLNNKLNVSFHHSNSRKCCLWQPCARFIFWTIHASATRYCILILRLSDTYYWPFLENGWDQLIVYRGIDRQCLHICSEVSHSFDPNHFQGTRPVSNCDKK